MKMTDKICQVVLVGHHSKRLFFSIDKEIFDKLIFIVGERSLSGTQKALKISHELSTEYKKRKVNVEESEFSFTVKLKPVAELTHLIYQQKMLGFDTITVNISGGLRYVNIWFYLACSITNTRVIHGDFIYDESSDEEVSIYKNDLIEPVYMGKLTEKQFEFMKLFFNPYKDYREFFDEKYTYDENELLKNIRTFNSIEELRIELNKTRNAKDQVTRGSINGFIRKLNKLSALKTTSRSQNKKQITLSYIGIAYFLRRIFEENNNNNNN